MSENRISRPYDEFCEYDCLIAFTEGAEGPGGVHKDVRQELDIDFGMTKLLGLLLSTIQAVVPARLQIQNL